MVCNNLKNGLCSENAERRHLSQVLMPGSVLQAISVRRVSSGTRAATTTILHTTTPPVQTPARLGTLPPARTCNPSPSTFPAQGSQCGTGTERPTVGGLAVAELQGIGERTWMSGHGLWPRLPANPSGATVLDTGGTLLNAALHTLSKRACPLFRPRDHGDPSSPDHNLLRRTDRLIRLFPAVHLAIPLSISSDYLHSIPQPCPERSITRWRMDPCSDVMLPGRRNPASSIMSVFVTAAWPPARLPSSVLR